MHQSESTNTRILLAAVVILSTFGRATGQAQDFQHRFFDPRAVLDDLFRDETDEDRAKVERIEISRRQEMQFGQQLLDQAVSNWRQNGVSVSCEGSDVEYVQTLVNRLHPLMRNAKRYDHITVQVADTDLIDARSFPGGNVVVFRGLIDFCQSEAAMVGILGHELSHIDHGHQLYYLRRWKMSQQSFQSISNFDQMMKSGIGMAKLFMRPFRPAEETQADQDGARWAFELGYDPSEMAKVFGRLAKRDRGRRGQVVSFLQSHPYHEDRFRAILKQSEMLKRQAKQPRLYKGEANLKSRTPWIDE